MTVLFDIIVKTSAKKELKKIPKHDLTRIIKKISLLAQNPRPEGSTKLTGKEFYRVRQGDYRVVYSIDDGKLIVWVVRVAHRKEVYKAIQ